MSRTGELYRVPRICQPWHALKECITWPRYQFQVFASDHRGDSMLDLTDEEKRALQIVVLKTDVRQERYGATHQFNWKKVGLSRA